MISVVDEDSGSINFKAIDKSLLIMNIRFDIVFSVYLLQIHQCKRTSGCGSAVVSDHYGACEMLLLLRSLEC